MTTTTTTTATKTTKQQHQQRWWGWWRYYNINLEKSKEKSKAKQGDTMTSIENKTTREKSEKSETNNVSPNGQGCSRCCCWWWVRVSNTGWIKVKNIKQKRHRSFSIKCRLFSTFFCQYMAAYVFQPFIWNLYMCINVFWNLLSLMSFRQQKRICVFFHDFFLSRCDCCCRCCCCFCFFSLKFVMIRVRVRSFPLYHTISYAFSFSHWWDAVVVACSFFAFTLLRFSTVQRW